MARKRIIMPMPRKMGSMSMWDYQLLAQRTSPNDGHDRMDNGVLGLIGETGEIVDLLKKHRYQSTPDTPQPNERYCEELGDVLWYMAELCAGMQKDLQVMIGNDFCDIDMAAQMKFAGRQEADIRKIILNLSMSANAICEHVEKAEFERAEYRIRRMMIAAGDLAFACKSCLQDVASANIEKLKARYPDGFDAEISMQRYD